MLCNRQIALKPTYHHDYITHTLQNVTREFCLSNVYKQKCQGTGLVLVQWTFLTVGFAGIPGWIVRRAVNGGGRFHRSFARPVRGKAVDIVGNGRHAFPGPGNKS